MLNALKDIVDHLPSIMRSGDWKSMFIDYDNPTLLRMYRDYKGYKVSLHKFIPTDGPVVYHPHPWPAAFIVSTGSYEMYFGYGKYKASPPLGPMVLNAGSYYQMTSVKEWHTVRPLERTFTLVVEGKPYKDVKWDFEADDDNNDRFRELNAKERRTVWNHFSDAHVRWSLKRAMARCPESPPKMTNFFKGE